MHLLSAIPGLGDHWSEHTIITPMRPFPTLRVWREKSLSEPLPQVPATGNALLVVVSRKPSAYMQVDSMHEQFGILPPALFLG